MTVHEVLEVGLNLGRLNIVQPWLDIIILEVFPNLNDSRTLYRHTSVKWFVSWGKTLEKSSTDGCLLKKFLSVFFFTIEVGRKFFDYKTDFKYGHVKRYRFIEAHTSWYKYIACTSKNTIYKNKHCMCVPLNSRYRFLHWIKLIDKYKT